MHLAAVLCHESQHDKHLYNSLLITLTGLYVMTWMWLLSDEKTQSTSDSITSCLKIVVFVYGSGTAIFSQLVFVFLDKFQSGFTTAKHWVSSPQGDKWFIGVFGRWKSCSFNSVGPPCPPLLTKWISLFSWIVSIMLLALRLCSGLPLTAPKELKVSLI